jgi:hypothetical protein
MTEIHSFGNLPVIAHAWNKDRTRMKVEKKRIPEIIIENFRNRCFIGQK